MKQLYTREGIEAKKKRVANARRLALATGLLGLGLCIALCFGVRTANAQERQILVIALAAAAGWAVLLLTELCILPELREIQHEEGILREEPELCEGEIISVGPPFRIPKSIAFCTVTLRSRTGKEPAGEPVRETEENPFLRDAWREKDGGTELSLKINARRRRELPEAGASLRLETRRQYITALQPLSGEAAERNGEHGREGRGRLRRGLRLASHLLLWALAGAVFWSWIFTFLTDAPRGEKITLFADMQTLEDRALSIRLEENLPEGIRLAQVHAFRYAMLDASALETADLYIMTEAGVREHMSWLTELPERWSRDGAGTEELLVVEGRTVGLRVCGGEGPGAAASFLSYQERPEEDWYLCFGAGGFHLTSLEQGRDNAAEAVAAELLSLP